MMNAAEHANFFEARATEYSKAATMGDWHGEGGVWESFEKNRREKMVLSLL